MRQRAWASAAWGKSKRLFVSWPLAADIVADFMERLHQRGGKSRCVISRTHLLKSCNCTLNTAMPSSAGMPASQF
jgi:hypothetical protein